MTNVVSPDNEKLKLTRLQCAKGKLSTELDGETDIFDTETGGYSSLDPVGTVTWTGLEQPICLKNTVDKILGEQEVERKQLVEDLIELLVKTRQGRFNNKATSTGAALSLSRSVIISAVFSA